MYIRKFDKETRGFAVFHLHPEPGENNQVARRFLLEHPDFEPYPVSLPEGYERNSFDRENEATLFVKKNGTDGFFFSGFRRLR